ncbi:hypothetical protein [uncultured Amnibacterium sp.]|uniref:hypothetical protein n=1 Tax=uncultured Amnibacterium sp. TaxID=1631851 RepID=UPI0035C9C174
MTSALHASFPLALPARADTGGRSGLESVAEHLGLALLAWAARRRDTPPRTIDPTRVERAAPSIRPFC